MSKTNQIQMFKNQIKAAHDIGKTVTDIHCGRFIWDLLMAEPDAHLHVSRPTRTTWAFDAIPVTVSPAAADNDTFSLVTIP